MSAAVRRDQRRLDQDLVRLWRDGKAQVARGSGQTTYRLVRALLAAATGGADVLFVVTPGSPIGWYVGYVVWLAGELGLRLIPERPNRWTVAGGGAFELVFLSRLERSCAGRSDAALFRDHGPWGLDHEAAWAEFVVDGPGEPLHRRAEVDLPWEMVWVRFDGGEPG